MKVHQWVEWEWVEIHLVHNLQLVDKVEEDFTDSAEAEAAEAVTQWVEVLTVGEQVEQEMVLLMVQQDNLELMVQVAEAEVLQMVALELRAAMELSF
jgi:hypothetical protein